MLYIIGVGPGDPGLITAKGLDVMRSCRIIAGWSSVITRLSDYLEGKEVITLTYGNQAQELAKLVARAVYDDVALLIHGDPSVSEWELVGNVKELCRIFKSRCTIVPGVSSINAALAAVGLDMTFTVLQSFHARNPPSLESLNQLMSLRRYLVIIPPPSPTGPQEVARYLTSLGYDCEVTVVEDVTLPDQRITRYRLRQLSIEDRNFSILTIVIVNPCEGTEQRISDTYSSQTRGASVPSNH